MENYKIVECTNDYNDRLQLFLHKVFPNYSDEYIDYCVSHSYKNNLEDKSTLLVVNNKDEIVGCHLFYNTKANVLGKITNVRWGHDTFLDESFRHKTTFPRIISEIDAFGIGLSEINKKIQQHYNILFYDNLYNYLWLNNYIIADIFRCILKKEPNEFGVKNRIEVKGYVFNRANNVDDITFPKDGFWCNNSIDVDFIRDRNFMEYRFFNNKVHQYYIFHLETEEDHDVCYFIVRPIRFKGFYTLYIVDFRYDLSKPQQLKAIFRAANKLAKYNKMGSVLVTSNDTTLNLIYNHFYWKKSPIDLYAKGRYKSLKGANLFITAADSDVDFLR